ncbi:Protein saal1 [Cichlidogyrus casuarinus]|uniref:Protein saal1 n=1 Tax=Cichlidogyrus casuarinus TaxID=1844966 RepID=A0ABD2Q4G3_9PLAT
MVLQPASGRNSVALDNGMMEGPPQFVAQPKGEITVMEGDPATISARVKPAGDSSLKCEWYRNGKALCAASRFNPTFDRGYAVLEFLYTHEDDNGDYYCLAKSNSGQDQSAICHLTIHSAEGVVTDTQLPEESMVANLAAMEDYLEQSDLMRNYRPDDDKMIHTAPVMVRQPTPQLGLRENQPAHFECVVEPAGDPNLVVEWFKDGKPVSMGCRFNALLDRGWAILDIVYCRADDSGQYYCLVTNSKGSVQSSVVQLHCTEEGGIITQSALSKDSIAYLESLDSWNTDAMAAYDGRPAPEDHEEPCAPSFVILPKALTAVEGTPVRFLVRADGNPRPRVQWYINGDLIASDGGISYLEFHRCGHPDTYQIHIVAKNQHGEASADTMLTIEPAQDYRPDLKHVMPENSFKKFMMLKHVDSSEYKGRTLNTNEVEETENLYAKIQASLRSGRRSVPPQSPAVFTQPPPQPQPPKPAPMVMGGMSQPKPVTIQQNPASLVQQVQQPHQVLATPPPTQQAQQQVFSTAPQQQVQQQSTMPQQQVQVQQQSTLPQQQLQVQQQSTMPQQQVQVQKQSTLPQQQVQQQTLNTIPQQQVQQQSTIPQQQVQVQQQSTIPQQQSEVQQQSNIPQQQGEVQQQSTITQQQVQVQQQSTIPQQKVQVSPQPIQVAQEQVEHQQVMQQALPTQAQEAEQVLGTGANIIEEPYVQIQEEAAVLAYCEVRRYDPLVMDTMAGNQHCFF